MSSVLFASFAISALVIEIAIMRTLEARWIVARDARREAQS
ncbi:hypothetical protein [Dyella humicola]|nr:hypothetical protein [Dyella humicola]